MERMVKCRICNETLLYDSNNIYMLGEHQLADDHIVTHYGFENDSGDGIRCFCAAAVEEEPKQDFRQRRLIKTTVETWNQGQTSIKCPKCGKSGKLLLKKQKNKVMMSTTVGALWMFGCWPFCLLPFMVNSHSILKGYCQFCGHFLGTFDRQNGQFHRQSNEQESVVEVKY